MEHFGTRITHRRQLLGLSQRELGDLVGLSARIIDKLECGLSPSFKKLPEIAKALKVPPEALLPNQKFLEPTVRDSRKTSKYPKTNMATKPFSRNRHRDLPVLGRAQGGQDGNLTLAGDTIEWTYRPADLTGVHDAFAVFVTGDSMVPKYSDGDLAYVHPDKPIRHGRHVLLETTDHHAFIKKFIKWDGNRLILEQYNPDKQLHFDRNDVLRLMLIIGSMDA